MTRTPRFAALVAALNLPLAGCGGPKAVTSSDDASTAEATSTTTGGTTGGVTTSGAGGTSDSTNSGSGPDGTDGSAATGATTNGDATTGGLSSYDDACLNYCELIVMCLGGELSDCLDVTCQPGIEPGSECEAAWIDHFECSAALTCREFQAPNRCDDLEDPDLVCQNESGRCGEGGFGFGQDGCSLSEPCPDHSRELSCIGDTCQCLEDGMVVAECPADMTCVGPDIEVVNAKAGECCGWNLLDHQPG